jgi:hypothetical protein
LKLRSSDMFTGQILLKIYADFTASRGRLATASPVAHHEIDLHKVFGR